MSSFWNFVFGAVLVVIWVVAGGFITAASLNLTAFRDTDENLHRAYWFAFWAAFVTWTLVIIFVILVILSIIGLVALFGSGVGEAGVAEGAAAEEGGFSEYASSPEGQQLLTQGISWFTIAFLVFALILVGITGVLSTIAASSMAASSNFNRNSQALNTAYTDCIVAASMCLGAAGILLIGIITYFIIGLRAQQAKDREYAQIRQLQRQALLRRVQQRAQDQQIAQLQQQAIRQRLLQQELSFSAMQPTTPTATPITLLGGAPSIPSTSHAITAALPQVTTTQPATPITILGGAPTAPSATLTQSVTRQGVSLSLPPSINIGSGASLNLPQSVQVPLPSSLSRFLS